MAATGALILGVIAFEFCMVVGGLLGVRLVYLLEQSDLPKDRDCPLDRG